VPQDVKSAELDAGARRVLRCSDVSNGSDVVPVDAVSKTEGERRHYQSEVDGLGGLECLGDVHDRGCQR